MPVFSLLSIVQGTPFANWYVDSAVAVSGNGLTRATAFKTIQEGVDAASAGEVVAIYDGPYREAVTLTKSGTAGNPITLLGVANGSAHPVIEGGDLLGGWVACTDQADALGSAQWASMFKAFVPASNPINQMAYNLRQSDLQMYLPERGAAGGSGFVTNDDTQNPKDSSKFAQGTSSTATTLTLDATTKAAYPANADLDNAYVALHDTTANTVFLKKISAYNATTGVISFSTTAGATLDGKFAIINAGLDLERSGQWAFKDVAEGDGTRKVVCYPLDSGAMNAIQVTNRAFGIDVANKSYWTIQGLTAKGQGDGGGVAQAQYAGIGFGSYTQNSAAKVGLTFRNLRVENTVNWYYSGVNYSLEAAISLSGPTSSQLTVESCTTYRTMNMAGVYMNGSTTDVHDCDIDWPGSTGIRMHNCTDWLCYDNRVTNVFGSHANGMSFYTDDIWGVVAYNYVRSEKGIGLTYNAPSNLLILCNDVQAPVSESSHRGIENNGQTAPSTAHGGVISVLNNTCGPAPGVNLTESSLGITVGLTGEVTHNAVNNATQGGCDWAIVTHGTNAVKGQINRNVLTGLASTQSASAAYFADQENSYRPTVAGVFVDYAGNDYLPTSGGTLDGTGTDISSLLAPFRARFPSFNFDRDIAGRSVDWASDPFIGAYKPTVTLSFDRDAVVSFADAADTAVGAPQVTGLAQVTGLVGQVWAQLNGGTAGSRQLQIVDTDGVTVIDAWRAGPALLANGQYLNLRGNASDTGFTTLTVIGKTGNTDSTFSIITAEAFWEQIATLAASDGWNSYYDVSIPSERTLSGLNVAALSDELGNLSDVTQSTAYGQYSPNEFGDLSGITMTSAQRGLISTVGFTDIPQPFFTMQVVRDDSNTQAQRDLMKANAFLVFTRNVANNPIAASAGTIGQSTFNKNGAPHIVETLANGASSKIWVDGVQVFSGNLGAGAFGAPLSLGSDGSNSSRLIGAQGPFLVYAGDPGSTKQAAMRNLLSSLTGIAV